MAILEEAIKKVLTVKNYIGGELVESESEKFGMLQTRPLRSFARLPMSTREEVDEAIKAAQDAFPM